MVTLVMRAVRAQPQAAARPVADEGAGAGDRDGGGRRRGDVRHVPVELRLAAAHAAEPTTSGSGSPTCSRRSSARRCRSPTDIAAIPGVAAVETRVVADVTLDSPGMDEPASGRLVSIPARRAGRGSTTCSCAAAAGSSPAAPTKCWPARRSSRRTGSSPAIACAAVINGRLRRLTIVGVALSPEYIYSIRPGEIDSRRPALRHLLDGAASARGGVRHGGRVQRRRARRWRPARRRARSIARLDRLLEPYGGLGAIPRALQLSHWTSRTSSRSCRRSAFLLPLDLPARGGVHPERRADARAGAAAAADRGAQGARLQQPRARRGTT